MAWFDIKGRDALSATGYGGANYGGSFVQGPWSVNVAGSGTAAQSATAATPLPQWLLIAAVVGGAWWLLHRRK